MSKNALFLPINTIVLKESLTRMGAQVRVLSRPLYEQIPLILSIKCRVGSPCRDVVGGDHENE